MFKYEKTFPDLTAVKGDSLLLTMPLLNIVVTFIHLEFWPVSGFRLIHKQGVLTLYLKNRTRWVRVYGVRGRGPHCSEVSYMVDPGVWVTTYAGGIQKRWPKGEFRDPNRPSEAKDPCETGKSSDA